MSMKKNILGALILTGVGIGSFVYQGVAFATRSMTFDTDLIQVVSGKVSMLPTFIGSVMLIGGIVMLSLAAGQKSARKTEWPYNVLMQ
jgi:hypothetical protein